MKKKIIIGIAGIVVIVISSILGVNIKKNLSTEKNSIQDKVATVDSKEKKINEEVNGEKVEEKLEVKKNESYEKQNENLNQQHKNDSQKEDTKKENQKKEDNVKNKTKKQDSKTISEENKSNINNEIKNENDDSKSSNVTNDSKVTINENNKSEEKTTEDDVKKFNLYKCDFNQPVCSGYSIITRYVEIDIENRIATLIDHIDLLDNSEEEDYDEVVRVRHLSDSEAENLVNIYNQLVVNDSMTSIDFVKEMIGLDKGWDYNNETMDEYFERITVYYTYYNGEESYIYGVNWIRMLSYLFEE